VATMKKRYTCIDIWVVVKSGRTRNIMPRAIYQRACVLWWMLQSQDVDSKLRAEQRIWTVEIAQLITVALLRVPGAFDSKLRLWFRCTAWAGRGVISFGEVHYVTLHDAVAAFGVLELERIQH
jgi:hypothetical protein